MEAGLQLVDHCDLYVQSKARTIHPFAADGFSSMSLERRRANACLACGFSIGQCAQFDIKFFTFLSIYELMVQTADDGCQAPTLFQQQPGRLRAILEAGAPCCKARLLHYFAPEGRACSSPEGSNWCGWHTDHSSLTGALRSLLRTGGCSAPRIASSQAVAALPVRRAKP